MKISVYKTKDILLVAQHYFENEKFEVRHFSNQDYAAEFIEYLATED